MLVTGFPIAFITSAFAFIWIDWYSLLFFLWMPYIYIMNFMYQKKFRLYLSPEALQLRTGVWGKESKLAQWYKIQYLELNQSFYQRRKQLATLIIHTAGGQIKIPYIDLALAHRMKNYALYKVEKSDKSWM